MSRILSYLVLLTASIWVDVAKAWYLYGLWPSSWGLYALFTVSGGVIAALFKLWEVEALS